MTHNSAIRNRAAIAYLSLTALAWVGACLNGTSPADTRSPIVYELVVSDTTSPASVPGSRVALSPSASGSEIVYVSLWSGASSEDGLATIRNLRNGSTVTVPVNAGGFDPVAVDAVVGDTLAIVVRNASGAVVFEAQRAVAASCRPVVVRTNPPPRKRDVPLNTSVVVVFSEPVAGGTVTRETIRLLRAGQPINGQLVLEGDGLRAVFRPDGLLASGAEYTLLIMNSVKDLEGEPLEQSLEVTFTTGATPTQAASVTVAPASASVHSDTTTWGARVELTATVRDSRGAEITGAVVAWASSTAQVARVDATGLVSGLSPGTATITATVDGLRGTAVITVLPAVASMSLQVDGVPLLLGGQYVRVEVGQTARLVTTARDASGNVVTGYRLEWYSDPHLRLNPLAGTSADVTPLRPGEGHVTVCWYPASGAGWSGGCTGATIQTPNRAAVASIDVKPDTLRTGLGAWVWLQAIVRDVNGSEILFAPVAWSRGSLHPQWGGRSIFLIRNVSVPTSLSVVATAGARSDTANVVFDYVTLASASVGINGYACFLTPTGAAYCSGSNYSGELGIGATGPGGDPVGVAGGLTFATLSTGYGHSCALSPAGAAYCWGSNGDGKLGIGTEVSDCDSPAGKSEGVCSNRPVAVSGGLTFTHISAGATQTCALTSAGAAYCWGSNGAGELGDGTTNSSSTPVAVAGGLAFAQISAGGSGFTCALTIAGAAYCWGNNSAGQLGDGSFTNRASPVPTAVGLTFIEVTAGGSHACGLTSGGAAYCWGGGDEPGLLGDGTTVSSSLPVAVSLPTGVTIAQIDAGDYVSCGVARDGAAYCWGAHTTLSSTEEVVLPTRVPGGLTFTSVNSGYYGSCGVTPDPIVYCWDPVVGTPNPVVGQR